MKKKSVIVFISLVCVLGCYYLFTGHDKGRFATGFSNGNFICDKQSNFLIEANGQAILFDLPYIYSYGESGFLCLNEDNGSVVLLLNSNFNSVRVQSFQYYKKEHNNNVFILKDQNKLPDKEKQIYERLKKTNNRYPFYNFEF